MKGPAPTVDVLIEMTTDGKPGLVFIERKHEPLGWAIPGGFIDEGETAAAAAVREAKEETELDVELVELFHVYSDPSRDPRRHTMSVVFIGKATGTPQGADDAAEAAIYPIDQLPELVFDHGTIVADYLHYRKTGERPPTER